MPELSVKHVVLISGPIASGKTTLSRLLQLCCGFCVLSTRELLAQGAQDRRALQAVGASLDKASAGRWVRDGLVRLQSQSPDEALFVVDSVRTLHQVRWVREGFGALVKHVHLTANPEVLADRHCCRFEGNSYQDIVADPVERRVGSLALWADLVVDTGILRPDSVLELLVGYLAQES